METGKSNNKGTQLRIGMAQTLNYYLDNIDWVGFFRILDCEVVITEKTNQHTFNIGEKHATNDQCFPIKAFYGHIMELVQSNVDYIFISQLISQEKGTFCCPKIIGLPMLIQNSMDNIPPVIFTPINKNTPRITYKKVLSMASKLCNNPFKIMKALSYFKKEFNKKEFNKTEVIYKDASQHIQKIEIEGYGKIGFIAHGYSLNDSFLSMGLIERIKSYGFSVETMSDIEKLKGIKPVPIKPYFNFRPLHWTYGQKVLASVEHFLEDDSIKGIIFLTYFGCGIDAFIEEVFKSEISNRKPYVCVTLDEHTGEGGLVTRIEAFLDMIGCNKGGISA